MQPVSEMNTTGVATTTMFFRGLLDKINADFSKVLAMPDVRERFAGLSVEPRTNSPEQFQQLVDTYAKRWAKVARDANVKVE